MKEEIITKKKLIKELKKNGVFTIDGICINCLHEVIQDVLDEFKPSVCGNKKSKTMLVFYGVTEVSPEMYRLDIKVRL